MLIICLRSRSTDWTLLDNMGFLVQSFKGFFSIRCDSVDYYVPEAYAYMLYLIDPHLQRYPKLDYIA